ncbi:hypothetical protein BDW59DRAFT_93244 [Aspergillus cavernicola]|uniref:Transcription factor hoxa13 n=1 Tax=Aspergillus cavernicola TaxID=176166 RepID=A0ABR4IZ69_9EURO
MTSSNGKVLETSDKAVVPPEQRGKAGKTSSIRWTVGLLVRLCIWYFLLTPFFRCPSNVSDLTESSPRICKPYLVAKSHIEPHVAPYYNTYGAPYVDLARPYVRVLNEKVYTPASTVAKQGYERYGAPALDRAQAYGQQHWDANVVPHIQIAKGKANDWYGVQVARHVEHIGVAVSPYYHKVHGAYWATLDGYVLPFCARYQPFIGKTYSSGQEILTTTVMPYAQSTWSSAIYLVNTSIWPKISSLYSENVEPQLVKIGQRLASYREGSRLRSVADEVESAAGYPAPSSSTIVESSGTQSPIASSVLEATPTPSLSPSELAAQLREKISSDLIIWKGRFASASEKGVEDLERRVVEIVETYLASGELTRGEQLVTALESAVGDQTSTIKRHISVLTESLPFEEAPEEEDIAVSELLKEVRNSAMSIRDRAHVLREWHVSFERGLVEKVSAAVNSTLAVLDNVRDLGLQEIGMRWAWMDGVTYKDWADYHALKAEFDDWKDTFREVGLQHARIEAAKELADDVLSHGMDLAEAAAKELARLKDVGRWKLAAREVSDDFDTRSEPPPALPKPTPAAEEDVSFESSETQQVPLEAEDSASDENSSPPVVEKRSEPDSESLESDEIQEFDEGRGAIAEDEELSDTTSEPTAFSEDSTDDEPKDRTEAHQNNAPFGAAAAAVIPDRAAVDSDDDADNMDFDAVVDAEATNLAEALSQSLGAEDPIVPPTPNHAPAEHKAVEDLLSQLLAGKDASFAEEILKKLHDIYETPQPSRESVPSEPLEDEYAASAASVSVVVDAQDNTESASTSSVLDVVEDLNSSKSPETIETEPTGATDSDETNEDQSTQNDL